MATNTAIDQYVAGLQYDPRVLLSVPADGSTQTLPARDRTNTGNGVIVCTNEKSSINKNFSDIVILNTTAGAIFPGALVRANQRLAEGNPDAVTLPRADVKISLDLPGLGEKGTRVVKPKYSDVQTAISEILEYFNSTAAAQGYINSARSFQTVTKAYSSDQLALDLGFSTKWTSGALSSRLSASGSREVTIAVAFFKQVYYTATMDFETGPGSAFAPEVTVNDLARVGLDKDNPPAYVASVDYGRLVMVKMETFSSQLKTDVEGALQQVTSGGEVSGDLKAKYEQITSNSTFTVIALGGNPNEAARISEPKDLKQLPEIIRSGASYSREHPGAPISYTTRFLKDNQLARVGFTTDFNRQECVQYPNGFVKLVHAGAYVAKFTVKWSEPDAAGNYSGKTWESGNKTAGYSITISMPGDARDVKIEAWAATGLVWDPWGEIMSLSVGGPNQKTYKVTGTTLNRSYEVTGP